ncbi:hypothetical protein BJX99DRAFT_269898 [Aspergillus californicus]
MSPPIVLITGSNQGIGLATAQSLAKNHNYHVLIGARNIQAGEDIAASLRAAGHKASSIQLDLTSEESIKSAVTTIEENFGYLDVLVNNAGILLDRREDLSTWDLFNQTFTTNVIGTATLTESLLPLLRKSKAGPPRIVFVSSSMGSLHNALDKSLMCYPIDYKAYDASKAAANMLMLNYARILEPDGGKVNSVCPGLVKTNLTAFTPYGGTPEAAAERIVEMAVLGVDGPSGTFSCSTGEIPW